jgi:hypothetical protein
MIKQLETRGLWPTDRPRRGASAAAYTVVEVMMSLAVLAVGVIGIIAMQKVTLATNTHSKNLAIATHIAQSLLGVLEAEAMLWGPSSSPAPLGRTTWLAQGAGATTWFRPNYDNTRLFGPAFDALGNPVRTQDQDPDARFCVDLRLSPLTASADGGGMIRAEVRVIWLRDSSVPEQTLGPTHACAFLPQEVFGDDEQRLFHFLFMSGAVRQVGAT